MKTKNIRRGSDDIDLINFAFKAAHIGIVVLIRQVRVEKTVTEGLEMLSFGCCNRTENTINILTYSSALLEGLCLVGRGKGSRCRASRHRLE